MFLKICISLWMRIINLFSNATKFTPENGTIAFSAKEFDNYWQFSISDTGIGIPEDKIPKLFDKFYQVDNHMTRKEGGTGLGLVIVKKIVELHKGAITLQSEVDQGTTFTLKIPKLKQISEK